jgi:hypothetical protein
VNFTLDFWNQPFEPSGEAGLVVSVVEGGAVSPITVTELE